MADFDPDEYLRKKRLQIEKSKELDPSKKTYSYDDPVQAVGKPEETDFDPDVYLEKKRKEIKQKESPSLYDQFSPKAALQGAGNAATVGYLPELQAAAEPYVFGALNSISGRNIPSEGTTEEYRKRGELLKEQNPKSYLAGTIAGSIPPAVAGGGLVSKGVGALEGAVPALEGMTEATGFKGLLGRGAQAAAGGGLIGAAENPQETGESRVQGAKSGAGIGLIGQGAGEALSGAIKGSKGLIIGLGDMAEKRAFKALGPYQRDVLKNADRINSIGRTVLDEGILSGGWEKTAEAAEKAKTTTGKELGDLMEDINNKVIKMAGNDVPAFKGQTQSKFGLDKNAILESLQKDLITDDVYGNKSTTKLFKNMMKDFSDNSLDYIGITDADKLKRGFDKLIKWDRIPGTDIPDKEVYFRTIRNKLRQGIEDATDAAAQSVGGPTKDALIALKQKYGNLDEAYKIASKRSQKEFANRMVSKSDYTAGLGAGAMAAATGHSPEQMVERGLTGFLVGALGNKAARYFGNEATGKALNQLSKKFSDNPYLYRKWFDPISETIQSDPEKIGALLVNINNQTKEKPKGLIQ